MKCKILQVLPKLTVQRQTRAFYQTEKKKRLRWLVLTLTKEEVVLTEIAGCRSMASGSILL